MLLSVWCWGETGFILLECDFFVPVADYLDVKAHAERAFQTSGLSGGGLSAVLPAFFISGRDKGSGANCRSFLGTHCQSEDGGEMTVGNRVHVVKPVASHFTLRTLPVLIINTLRTGSFKLLKTPFPGFLTI